MWKRRSHQRTVKVMSLITYQSVEAHRSTACSPVFMLCNISPSTSEDCIITKIWLIIEDSLRIRPITMHQSRHPASMKMCSKYLYTEAETQWLMLGRIYGWREGQLLLGKQPMIPNLPKHPEEAFSASKMLRNSPKLDLGFVRPFTRQLHGDMLQLWLG